MAVALRSSSDLVYLPDHGFVGEDGALRILINVTRQIHRLDISHNLLGEDGIGVLIQGLTTLRLRYSSADFGMWGLREMNLGYNAVTDQAFSNILSYSKKDVFLSKLLVQGNDIRLRDNLTSIIHSINSSRLSTLSLTSNTSLHLPSLVEFFEKLDAPHLTELHLSTCNIDSSLGTHIARFLQSQRSRSLETLELNGNNVGAESVTRVIDAVESSNFTIKQLGLLANGISDRPTPRDEDEVVPEPNPAVARTEEEKRAEGRALAYQIGERLAPILERNRILTRRIRNATTKAIGPARVLLGARPLTDHETAQNVIKTVGSRSNRTPFPILDLPREVLYHIARHCSEDPSAFSEAQFARLVKEAEDVESVGKLKTLIDERVRKARWGEEARVTWDVREEWLKKGKWDKWELDKPIQLEEIEDGEEDGAVDGRGPNGFTG